MVRKILLILISFVGVLAVVAGLIFVFPEILINSRTLHWAPKILRSQGIELSWTDSQIKFSPFEFKTPFKRNVILKLEDFCVGSASKLWKVCGGATEISAAVDIPHFTLSHLLLRKGKVDLDLTQGTEDESEVSEDDSTISSTVRTIIQNIYEYTSIVETADIDPLDFNLKTADLTTSAKIELTKNAGTRLKSTFQLLGRDPKSSFQGEISAVIISHQIEVSTDAVSKKSHEKAKLRLNIRLPADIENGPISLSSYSVQVRTADFDSNLEGSGTIESKRIGLNVAGGVRLQDPTGNIQTVEVNQIQAEIPESFERALVKGKLTAHLGKSLQPILSQANAPNKYAIEFELKQAPSILSEEKPRVRRYAIGLKMREQKFSFDGRAILSEQSASWADMLNDVHAELRVNDYQALVKLLNALNLGLIAPFQVMNGTLLAKFDSIPDRKGSLQVDLTTDVKSKNDSFITRTHATLSEPERSVDIDVELTKVVLTLPTIKIGETIPSLVSDSRFYEQDEKPKKPWSVRLVLRTPAKAPILIHSSLASQAIPVHLNLELTPKGNLMGKAELSPLSLEFFKRKVRVVRCNLKFNPLEEKINALFEVKQDLYKVSVFIQGPTQKPAVWMESDPPLSQQETIALLIFGKKMESLDPDQKDSSGQVNRAIQEGAMSLASLYFLASTPIQNIGYDPERKALKITFKVGDKTSITWGAGEDQVVDSIGLKRSLGGNWWITTEAQDFMKGRAVAVQSFLEKIIRY